MAAAVSSVPESLLMAFLGLMRRGRGRGQDGRPFSWPLCSPDSPVTHCSTCDERSHQRLLWFSAGVCVCEPRPWRSRAAPGLEPPVPTEQHSELGHCFWTPCQGDCG